MNISLFKYSSIWFYWKSITKSIVSAFIETRKKGFNIRLIIHSCNSTSQINLILKLIKAARFQTNEKSLLVIENWDFEVYTDFIFPFVKSVIIDDMNMLIQKNEHSPMPFIVYDSTDSHTNFNWVKHIKILSSDAYQQISSREEFKSHIQNYIDYCNQPNKTLKIGKTIRYIEKARISEMSIMETAKTLGIYSFALFV